MKIKNKDLYKFRDGFNELYKTEVPAECSLLIIKNQRLIATAIEDLEKIIKPTDAFLKEYQSKVEDIAKKYCIKNEKGIPIPKQLPSGGSIYEFTDKDRVTFELEVKELENKEELKSLIEDRKLQVEKYNTLLELDIDIDLYRIAKKLLPGLISPYQLDLIYELIDE